MVRLKKLLIYCYIIISIISFGLLALGIKYYMLFKKSIDNRNDYEKTCELNLTFEAELDCEWANNPRVAENSAEFYNNEGFNSDVYWIRINNQECYNHYKDEFNLPDYVLPSEDKYYIVSFGRKIDSFFISKVIMKNDGENLESFLDYYSLACDILENPQYRGIAKYDKDFYAEDKVFIYSVEKVSLLDPSVYDLSQIFW